MVTKRQKLGELVIPVIVLIGCFLYWLNVQEARSVARRVPDAVIIFTVVLAALVLMRAIMFPPVRPAEAPVMEAQASTYHRNDTIKRLIFVALCIGYYAAFLWLGFNLANVLFLMFAYPLAGLGIGWATVGALTSSAIFYGLAQLMEFNVPIGPLGF